VRCRRCQRGPVCPTCSCTTASRPAGSCSPAKTGRRRRRKRSSIHSPNPHSRPIARLGLGAQMVPCDRQVGLSRQRPERFSEVCHRFDTRTSSQARIELVSFRNRCARCRCSRMRVGSRGVASRGDLVRTSALNPPPPPPLPVGVTRRDGDDAGTTRPQATTPACRSSGERRRRRRRTPLAERGVK
jgi:hypothetical protein